MSQSFDSPVIVGAAGNNPKRIVKRSAVLLFGVAAYAMFLGVFLYAVGFVGNFLTPTRLDGAPESPFGKAIAINFGLLGLFAVQHSVMARTWFKNWWTRFVPEPIERSVYVLTTNIVLGILFWQWEPMGSVVWNVQNPIGRIVIYTLFAVGWATVLYTTFLINHFDLFGLRQVWLYFRGKSYTPLGFVTPGPYRIVRHPMYIGWMTAFWATPTMTVAHLTFALGVTGYILTAIVFEERDLVRLLGKNYADYREKTPMFVPRFASYRTAEAPRPGTILEPLPEFEDSTSATNQQLSVG
jgi:protein-S-isoprenylcysteine O-methyltransferase Ste14